MVPSLSSLVLLVLLAPAGTRAASGAVLGPELRDSPEGIELADGWLFQRGDDPTWADPALDDGDWNGVEPSLRNGPVPAPDWDGFAWFRLHVTVDPSLLDVPLALDMTQAGASEIYLDGVLVRKFGVVGEPGARDSERNPSGTPAILVFTGGRDHVIAVRYSCKSGTYVNRGLRLLRAVRDLGFGFVARLRLANSEPPARDAIFASGFHAGAASFLLALAVFHLVLFAHVPKQIGNFFLGVSAASFSLLLFDLFAQEYGQFGLKWTVVASLLGSLIYMLSGATFVAMVGAMFGERTSRWLAAFLATVAVVCLVPLAVPELTGVSLLVLFLLTIVLFARAIWSVRGAIVSHRGAWKWLVWSVAGWVVLHTQIVLAPAFAAYPVQARLVATACVALMFVVPSIYLVRKFAQAQRNLEAKLVDITALYGEKSATEMARSRDATPANERD
jgi:hypothetical protein